MQNHIQIIWLTRRQDHKVEHPQIMQLDNPNHPKIKEFLQRKSGTTRCTTGSELIRFGHDIENRISFPCKEALLLSSFCNEDGDILTIDNTSVNNNEVFDEQLLKRCWFIAHNADHEKRWGIATNFNPMRYGCTMVNSRRLVAGEDGWRNDLISAIVRYLGFDAIPEWMNKDVRNTFENCNYFVTDQILYNAADTIRLLALYDKQMEVAATQGRVFELNSLRGRLISELASTEMLGIAHNKDKWLEVANNRQIKADRICQELNELVKNQYQVDLSLVNPELKKKQESLEKRLQKQNLRLEKLLLQLKRLEEASKTHLKSYQLTKTQIDKITNSQETQEDSLDTDSGINWSSPKQVLTLMNIVNCPLPVGKDKKTKKDVPKVSKEARNSWFTNHSDTPFFDFMTKFDSYKKLIHNVNSFGAKWIDKYTNPVTGRIHTYYNQTGTTTGRFSSGDKANGYPNMQQIPKGKEYRECFVADPGRTIITIDFKNCEGIIMIALSGDLNLKAITELEDSHSYLGTKCWRNVYRHRGSPLADTYEMNKSTPEKEKERDIFKNSGGLFPVAYGIHASKVAASAKVSLEEGQIFIDTIKAEIPKVISFLDGKSREAVQTGYVLHNSRTNSRRGFTSVLDHLHYGFPLDKSNKVEVEMAARNSPIQGSNADIIVESIVSVALWSKLFKQDVRLLLQVHDELVYDCKTEEADFIAGKIASIMKRTAQKYLIPEISMGVSVQTGGTWKK